MIRKIIPFFIVTLLISACQKTSSYQNAEELPASGWVLGKSINFRDSLTDADPENLHYAIELRHSNIYPYQNIWLYIQTKCSDGTTRMDSIDCKLSEPNGRWLGTGWGSLYNISFQLPDLKIKKTSKKRWFSIQIQHGLRDETIKGIENIGVRLY